MKRTNNDLFPIVDREQEFQKIYNNTIEKVNYINSKYAENHNGIECEELAPLIEQMNDFVLNLSRVTKLEEYLSFKLLVQKILRLLGECDHDEVVPPVDPELEPVVIKAILQNLNKKLVGELLTSENDYLITSVEYELYKNNTRVEKVTTNSASAAANFTSTEAGSYYFLAKYYWSDKYKQIMSNTVVIEDEEIIPPPVDGEFPATLPYSNLWAHTVNSNGNYEITLNNTWGVIDSRLAVYLDGQLSEILDTNYTAANKGSAKNVVSASKFPSNKDLKFVYKVTYTRDEKTNDKVTVYYKSTTGTIEIATPDGGVKYCNYPEWNPEIEYGSATNKIVYYNGLHFRHTGWASKGDKPLVEGWSPWTKLSDSEEAAINCPGNHQMDSAGTAPNAHLEPMNVSNVEGLGTPMEKMHITYTPEWGKWGGRKYTPKISPWNKISHMQYAFVDVIPDYTGNFFTDKDDISHLTKSAADAPNGTSLNVSPNIFDPGAAFSAYGGTNAFMTEYNEMSKKYPYVKPIASLGGWSRSAFFRDAAQPGKIDHFVQRCIDFIREFNMVGIDIDWEFPCSRRDADLVDNKNDLGTPRAQDDEEYLFTNLMQALRKALDKAGEEDGKYYFLSCAIVSGKTHILKSGIGVWHPTCDFISYMTYDVHGAFDPITNHQSYLFQNPSEPLAETNPNENAMSINDLIQFVTTTYGVPVTKITVGSPFYSRGWSGIFKPASGWVNASTPGLYARTNIDPTASETKGCSAPGTMDGGRGAGVLPLNHLNKLIKGESVSVRTLDMNGPANPHAGTVLKGTDFKYYYDEAAQAPYLYNETAGIFYTYEDERSVEVKSQWVIDNNLAGIISWDIAMDDYGIDMHSSEATSAYPSLYQADHLLTSVIFEKFKANSLRLNYLNRLARR